MGCARINGRLDGCVEVAQHVVGNNSRTYYLKIDVARLKELKKGYEPPQAVKPPTYDHAVIKVEPSAPSKQPAKYTAPSKETGSVKTTGRTAAWTRAKRMAQIKKLRDDGILSEQEYKSAKERIR